MRIAPSSVGATVQRLSFVSGVMTAVVTMLKKSLIFLFFARLISRKAAEQSALSDAVEDELHR